MKFKILFVDDEDNVLSSLKRLFMEEGNYEIFTSQSGYIAIELMKRESFDIIVSDQRMPEMDGIEFLQQTKKILPESMRMMLTGFNDINNAIDAINKGEIYRYITKPWNNEELKATIQDAVELQRLRKENKNLLELTQRQNLKLKDLNVNLDKKVADQTKEIRSMYDELKGLYFNLNNGYIDSVKVLSNLIRLRRREISLHHRKTAVLAKKIAQEMELSDETVRDIEIASLLHDIGTIGMNDTILSKAVDDMDTAEKVMFMKHPILGQVLLQSIETMQRVGTIIRHHHEKWGGKGYPDNIKGQQIPIGSRIISVASDYDALINGSLLPLRFTRSEARQFILENKDHRYDPKIIQLSVKIIAMQEKELKNKNEFKVLTSGLSKDMVIARDVYTASGFLLLNEGMKLTKRHINNLINFETAEGKKYDIFISIPKRAGKVSNNDFGRSNEEK